MSGLLQASVMITVPFHDADPAGMVWHGNYFRYFELARCELLERIGYNYLDMQESGFVWPIVDLSSRFNRPVRYHDRIRVIASLEEWEYRLVMTYRVLDDQGEERARGRSVQVPVDMQSGEMQIGMPAPVEALFRKALADGDGQ